MIHNIYSYLSKGTNSWLSVSLSTPCQLIRYINNAAWHYFPFLSSRRRQIPMRNSYRILIRLQLSFEPLQGHNPPTPLPHPKLPPDTCTRPDSIFNDIPSFRVSLFPISSILLFFIKSGGSYLCSSQIYHFFLYLLVPSRTYRNTRTAGSFSN